jgi:DNA-binding NarL/FixJ family response regulator
MRICLVEDHDQLRALLTSMLRSEGIDVVAGAGSLSEGLAAVRASRPDVAVIDNHLPDGRGVDLCRQLRSDDPDLPLVIHTAFATRELLDEAQAAGVSNVVAKSPRIGPLLTAIRSCAVNKAEEAERGSF